MPIFALMLPAMILVAGFATDLSRHHPANLHVQQALDAAGLAAAREARINLSVSDVVLYKIAQRNFNAQLKDQAELSMKPLKIKRVRDEVHLSVKGKMPTSFMRYAGNTIMEIDTSSNVTVGALSQLEIALVLDLSDSMNAHGRLDALKVAAKDMVDTLVVKDSDKVKVSLVPFGQYVNVGMVNANASWLDKDAAYDIVRKACPKDQGWLSRHCPLKPTTCSFDGLDALCRKRVCDPGYDVRDAPKDLDNCIEFTEEHRWHGCVLSRTPGSVGYLKDSSYQTSKIIGMASQNANICAAPIVPLSNDADDLKTEIDALRARGGTHIPSGMLWGLRSLSSIAPFDEGLEKTVLAGKGGFKAVVLMSDGANTLATFPDGAHETVTDSSQERRDTDDNTLEVCNDIKSEGIEVYTVAFNVTETATQVLLLKCAASLNHAFKAENPDDLKDAFKAITEHVKRDIAIAS
ncbi:MAG: pilus assembly protein TadG-related protein [Pseudomonadota bacterium]